MARSQITETDEEYEEPDYAVYSNRTPTSLQRRFGDWLIDKLEVEFKSKVAEESFREGVRLAVALRIPFQASPENREDTARERQELAEHRAAMAEERTERTAQRKQRPEPEPEADETVKRSRPVQKKGVEAAANTASEAPARGGRRRARAATTAAF